MKDFRELKVWEKAHRLVIGVYRVTGAFPKEEMCGLTSQMRRAAASIPTNIAEGCGRGGDAEMARFVQIGMGSASELEYLLLLANNLGFLKDDAHATLTAETQELKRMLSGLLRSLRASGQPPKGMPADR
jgi:four helix bundle protein